MPEKIPAAEQQGADKDRTMARRCALNIPADHPSYAGHFPNFPVLPGAALLDEALHAISQANVLDLTQWQIAAAKFLDRVRPGDALLLEHGDPVNGLIRFMVHARDRKVLAGALSRIPGE